MLARISGAYDNKYEFLIDGEKFVDKLYCQNKKNEKLYPGDFVNVVEENGKYMIEELLPRKSLLSKSANGPAKEFHNKKQEKVIACNVDKVFVIIAANQRFTISKLERYLDTFSSDCELSIVISKADYEEAAHEVISTIQEFYPSLAIYSTRVDDVESIENLREQLKEYTINVFIGSSGAGKSTLINLLLGEHLQKTNEVIKGNSKGSTRLLQAQCFMTS